MKKSLLCGIALVFSLLLCAEKHQLGDYVELDGMPSIVVYIDESGEHGLLMSAQGIGIEENDLPKLAKINAQAIKNEKSQLQKRYKYYFAKRAKASGYEAVQHTDSMYAFELELIDKFYKLNRIIYTNANKKIKKEEWRKVYSDIKEKMAGSGEENMNTIVKYCAENNLSMQDYFPDFFWASQIGNGWFIPGNNELELLVQSCGFDSIGITHPLYFSEKTTKGELELYDKFDADRSGFVRLLNKATMGIDYYWFSSSGGAGYWPLACVQSSTMVASNWSKNIDNVHKAVTSSSSSSTSQIFDLSISSSSTSITQAEKIDFDCDNFYSTGLWTEKNYMKMFFYIDKYGHRFAMHRF